MPRNLSRGVYKGGGEKHELYRRIMLGIPGTPMPASTTLTEPEVLDLINYVQSLANDENQAEGEKLVEVTQQTK